MYAQREGIGREEALRRGKAAFEMGGRNLRASVRGVRVPRTPGFHSRVGISRRNLGAEKRKLVRWGGRPGGARRRSTVSLAIDPSGPGGDSITVSENLGDPWD